ncbi:hypothetical protein MKW92_001254, partial [Papaver armeniacum]
MQIAAINSALVTWAEPNGCCVLVQQALEEQEELQELRKSRKKKQELRNQESTNIRLCRKKLSYGMYTAAIRTLTSKGVAPANAGTLAELKSKHPYSRPPKIPVTPPSQSALIATDELVLGRIRSFPKGTSCGRDGLRAQHLIDALSGAAAAVADELVSSLTCIVNIWLAGNCPPELGV